MLCHDPFRDFIGLDVVSAALNFLSQSIDFCFSNVSGMRKDLADVLYFSY
jgi:hypothetical protein